MRASDRAYRTLLTEIQDGLLPAGAVLGEVEQAAPRCEPYATA